VERSGLEFRRGTNFERVAAGIEQDVNKRDEPLKEAIRSEPEFVGGIEDGNLTQKQEQFLERLVEFEEAEEEARREERQFEEFRDIREDEGQQAASEFLIESGEAQDLRQETFSREDLQDIQEVRNADVSSDDPTRSITTVLQPADEQGEGRLKPVDVVQQQSITTVDQGLASDVAEATGRDAVGQTPGNDIITGSGERIPAADIPDIQTAADDPGTGVVVDQDADNGVLAQVDVAQRTAVTAQPTPGPTDAEKNQQPFGDINIRTPKDQQQDRDTLELVGTGVTDALDAAATGTSQLVSQFTTPTQITQTGFGEGRTAIITPEREAIDTGETLERTVEAPDTGTTLIAPATRGEIRETGRQAFLSAGPLGRAAQRVSPLDEFGDDEFFVQPRNIAATQDLETGQTEGIPGAEQLDDAAREVGEGVAIQSGAPAVSAAATLGVREQGVEFTAQQIGRQARAGTITQVNALRNNPDELRDEIIGEGVGLLLTPFSSTVTVQPRTLIDSVKQSTRRTTVQRTTEGDPVTEETVTEINREAGLLQIGEEVEAGTNIEQGETGIVIERGGDRIVTQGQQREIVTSELRFVPDFLKTRTVTETATADSLGPVRRQRIEREELDLGIDELVGRSRRQGQVGVTRQTQDTTGRLRDRFEGVDVTPDVPARVDVTVPQTAVSLQATEQQGLTPGVRDPVTTGRVEQPDIGQRQRVQPLETDVPAQETRSVLDVQPQTQQQERTVPSLRPRTPQQFVPQTRSQTQTQPRILPDSDESFGDGFDELQETPGLTGEFAPSLGGLLTGAQEQQSAEELEQQLFSGVGIRGTPDQN